MQDCSVFYHIKNLQSTKTSHPELANDSRFITLRIYKVLKRHLRQLHQVSVLSH